MKNKTRMSRGIALLLTLMAVVLAAAVSGCSSAIETGGEEAGTALALDEMYDVVRNGVRLVMAYDAQSNAFTGTVENTTSGTLTGVRAKVHLSNGTELGPTMPVDLAPGEKVDVTLSATSQAFDGWTPHAEVGAGDGEAGAEHGSQGGEGGGERGSEGGGEHGGGGGNR